MTRTHLARDIEKLDQRLTAEQNVLRMRRAQSIAALQQTNPLWLVGIGVVFGVLTRCHGVQGVYMMGSLGMRSQRLLQTLAQQLMSRTGV